MFKHSALAIAVYIFCIESSIITAEIENEDIRFNGLRELVANVPELHRIHLKGEYVDVPFTKLMVPEIADLVAKFEAIHCNTTFLVSLKDNHKSNPGTKNRPFPASTEFSPNFKSAEIHMNLRELRLQHSGTNLLFEFTWLALLHELHNVAHCKAVQDLNRNARKKQIGRNDYVDSMLRLELQSMRRSLCLHHKIMTYVGLNDSANSTSNVASEYRKLEALSDDAAIELYRHSANAEHFAEQFEIAVKSADGD